MKHVVLVPTLVLVLFAVGCAEKRKVKVTYLSDPPGGTLYTANGQVEGPCPQVVKYDVDQEDVERGCLYTEGKVVRWADGPEKKSREPIRITVNGTDRYVVFLQPSEEPGAE